MFSYVYSISVNTTFGVCIEYSVWYGVQYSVHCSIQSSIQFSVQYCVRYPVSYNFHEAGNGLFLREYVSSPSQFYIWDQFIVHYSVQCTVQCTFYFLEQYSYGGYVGTQLDVNIQPVKTELKLFCQNKGYDRPKLLACFSLLAAMQDKPADQKVIHGVSSAPSFKMKESSWVWLI